MTIPNDYKDIVTTLLEKTNNGRVHWKKGRFGIEVQVDKSGFKLWSGTDEHTDEAFVGFALTDMKGATMDSWYVDASDSDFDSMNLLFAAAKRYAYGIPQRLTELKEAMSNQEYLGSPEEDDL